MITGAGRGVRELNRQIVRTARGRWGLSEVVVGSVVLVLVVWRNFEEVFPLRGLDEDD
jgi:hypothetical protein